MVCAWWLEGGDKVVRWCCLCGDRTWDRYRGDSRCHRGVMQLDKDLPLVERQRLAAARTHEVRQKATESKVRAACRQLQQKGETLTQAAIARLAGLSRQTVAGTGRAAHGDGEVWQAHHCHGLA